MYPVPSSTWLSCHRLRVNEVRLNLSLIAYKPWHSVAAAGAADEDRQLVAHQLAAAAGENGRAAGEACSLLLANPHFSPEKRGEVHFRVEKGRVFGRNCVVESESNPERNGLFL
ncbi:MAG TPA: hypothetical protein VMV31_13325 [Terriglobales bacterium]|nr:hypothetical protein [Terriglobales bacterium]